MPRPVNPSPKPRVNLVKRKQKNSRKHVCKVAGVYDPMIRDSRAITTELVGKILPGFNDPEHIVPTRKRRKVRFTGCRTCVSLAQKAKARKARL